VAEREAREEIAKERTDRIEERLDAAEERRERR
jgi:hypothetical protein